MRWRLTVAAVAASTIFGGTALAQAKSAERSPAFQRLVDCRAISDSAGRLACFDKEVATLDAAESSQNLVVMDRDQIKKTRRSLFGLTLPNLAVFGDDGQAEENRAIESKIKSAWMNGNGKWNFELVDGARWVQTDSRNLNIEPRGGHDINIRKAALGSYLANVNKQVAIRVQRIR